MKSTFTKFFMMFAIALSLASLSSVASAHCRWVSGHHVNGHYVQAHKVCWHRNWNRRHCGWRHGERVCW